MKTFFQIVKHRLTIQTTTGFLLIFSTLLFSGCNRVSYSLSGINLKGAQTIYIANVFNNAGGGPANLGQTVTESLKDYYQKNSPLKIVNGEADIVLEATVTQYDFQPTAIGADQAQQNRFSVTIQVNYTNTKDEEVTLKNTPFTFALNVANTKTISQAEADGTLTQIINQIVFDIFNKTAANW
jgi:hypothetical protein